MAVADSDLSPMESPPVLIQVLGPTGVGKSRMAIHLARKHNGEIISADSMQVYRGFDIGTDKLPLQRRGGVPHHLIDIVDDCSQFNAALFLETAFSTARAVRDRGHIPVVCGGTALYLRTMIRGIFPPPPCERVSRGVLKRLAEQQGLELLWKRLQRIDPEYGACVRPNDGIRIIRGLEIYYNHGKIPTMVFRETRTPFQGFRFIRIGLTLERSELYRRIEARVDRMLEQGLLEELQRLRKRMPPDCPPFRALGYRELGAYLDGKTTWTEAVEEIKRNSRRFAKRQLSWFRGEGDIRWFQPDEMDAVSTWLKAELNNEAHG